MNTTSRLGVALAGLAVAALGSVGMAAATSREPARGVRTQGSETKHAVITSRVQRVILDGKAGEVKVTATGRSAITVTHTSRWIRSKPKVRLYIRAGVLHLESRCEHTRDCSTNFRVRIPARVAIEVHEDAAEVEVNGAPGNVLVDVDAGDVSVDLSRAPRRIDAETDVGNVDISVPRGVYAVDADTRFGKERVRGLVQYDRATRRIRAETEVGDVTVQGR